MTKKLKIIGPYTPEHKGPFCIRDGNPVRLLTKKDGSADYPIVGFVNNETTPSCWTNRGFCFSSESENALDLMNAEEVPVAREFWVNEYKYGVLYTYFSKEKADSTHKGDDFLRTIHVREVLPGEGE